MTSAQQKPAVGNPWRRGQKAASSTYAVYHNRKIVATGSLSQCWLWLHNALPSHVTLKEVADMGYYIAPYRKGRR